MEPYTGARWQWLLLLSPAVVTCTEAVEDEDSDEDLQAGDR